MTSLKVWQILTIGVIIGLLSAGGILLISRMPAHQEITFVSPTQSQAITISVNGAVLKPGLYSLPTGSRVNDALQIAGGPSDSADLSAINLAGLISDGDQITVPEILDSTPGTETKGKININNATIEELDSLPGIGQEKAKSILEYRESYGPFNSIQDLLYVPGIGASMLDEIRDLVTIK